MPSVHDDPSPEPTERAHPLPLVTHPVITISLPCYNEGRWLAKTIKSIQDQTWAHFAVLISDNASTDDTGAIAQAAASDDPRFHYYRHESNQGSAANFNFAREATDSPLMVWIGAHDLIHPNFLEHHIEVLQGRPEVSVSESTHAWIGEDDEHIEFARDAPLAQGGANSPERYLKSIAANQNNIGINSVIRRDMLDGIGFTPVVGTDRIILSRLAFRGPFDRTDDTLYFRRAFKSRTGFEGYMERLTGKGTLQEDWSVMARDYDRDFAELLGEHRFARLYRLRLQLALRYYLPVKQGSVLTTLLWTVRRIIKHSGRLLTSLKSSVVTNR
jgi:glycosyltransferase involved in cell wall biosynthesis